MRYFLKTILSRFTCFFYVYLHFHVFLTTVQSILKNSFVEGYLIEGNPIEVYPREAYLIGRGVVEAYGCSRADLAKHNFWEQLFKYLLAQINQGT
jgi:hypothetical protein